ncbi:hypothetical protein VL20_5369 [Microcystis panniformis FACHB-1757]|uniref:Uncharacterized protein n=1 Tax=Microcystis panniformis FACHB-1757 TaxID=1638788 RepID=A0A0K1S835_9CHRO|nr:hypothetical protein VL20_5369 [Microcystis panniformis FACHB-1757]
MEQDLKEILGKTEKFQSLIGFKINWNPENFRILALASFNP